MVRYPLNDALAETMQLVLVDPVCSLVMQQYSLCRNNLLIPKNRFTDKTKLAELLESGQLQNCYDCDGNLECLRIDNQAN